MVIVVGVIILVVVVVVVVVCCGISGRSSDSISCISSNSGGSSRGSDIIQWRKL